MAIKIIPVVTEKANAISEKGNRFTFKVSPDANKHQIVMAIEEEFSIETPEESMDEFLVVSNIVRFIEESL